MLDLTMVQPETESCIRCGLCLDSCPTYVIDALELDSPRGRIALVEDAIASGDELTGALAQHIDTCLGDLACVSACPVGVRYDRILARARPAVEHQQQRSTTEQALRLLIFETLPYPKRLAALVPLLAAAKRIGAERLPQRLSILAKVAPNPPSRADLRTAIPTHTPARGVRRGRVGLLLGCVQRVFFADVHRATIAVLSAEGFDVVAPALPDCCGALELHAGEHEHALARAQATIAAFAAEGGLDHVIVNSAGCGAAMKDYGELLGHEPAAEFSAKVLDITEFLATIEPRAPRGPVPLKVAYQDACHLRHAQRVSDAPRALLRAIPELELVELAEPDICCGSAGTYNLLQPEMGDALGARKASHVLASGAQAVATANPGCAAQIARHAAEEGDALPVLHPVELLWRSLQAAR
jgi:glycolate oxidase iron-sulfur subunit